MKSAILFIFMILFFNGCVFFNARGVSTNYYNDCKEYYDATGTYKKECPHNIIDW
ncbi:hypothetical protein [Campylobacter pinnipediorum]|uniref:hypothetical protein n=1 Tax=Campylobacter pinnipediorum TaxID=1965231 RepID=UPI0015D660ED|nr:hypothetical protein [Campylobacter pinnipediorum]